MPCLLGCLALSTPRLVLLILFVLTKYLSGPFETNFWPVMGFLFMPMTTLGWAASWHIGNGSQDTWAVCLIVLGVFFDLGVLRLRKWGRRGGGGNDRRGDPPEGGGGGGERRPREIVIEAEKVG